MDNKINNTILENIVIVAPADKGKYLGKTADGLVVFVENAAPGDVVDVLITHKKKGFWEGRIVAYKQLSSTRTDAFCKHFDTCGGCEWQHIQYAAQLDHKEQIVQNAMQRIAKLPIQETIPILPSDETQYYRNKLEFTFSNRRWLTKEEINTDASQFQDVLGFHSPGRFDKVIDIAHFHLQGGLSNDLRNAMRDIAIEQGLAFFDWRTQTGFLRNVIVRSSTLGETMVVISFFEDNQKKIKTFLDALLKKIPDITSLNYCINSKANDFILDLEIHTYFGKNHIREQLGHLTCKIGTKSFFQTNSKQAKKLYDEVVQFAQLQGDEIVYDLYTGTGSIALYLAKHCKQVVGIEEVPTAIEDARENASINGINKAIFYAGDVKNILTHEFAERYGKPDVLITDPPRAGMHPQVVKMLLQLAAPKIVYVSCKPSTQARDLQVLSEKYEVIKSRAVDMFPHTHHIENIVLLALKKESSYE